MPHLIVQSVDNIVVGKRGRDRHKPTHEWGENVISKRITESFKANPGDKGAKGAGDMKN